MANLLAIPFKKTSTVPIKQTVWDFLRDHTDSHPEEFRQDINKWDGLRKKATGDQVHVQRVTEITRYHAQLVSIIAKLPDDITLAIPYALALKPTSSPITISSLAYERASILFNLAALHSQLAIKEDLESQVGIRRANTHFQSAAGTLAYLSSSALPKLADLGGDVEVPLDLSEPFIKSLEYLMLAQAQECVWLKARLEQYKDSLVAKLAAQAATFYQSSLQSAKIQNNFPSRWLSHLETKQFHFESVAQYRKSLEDQLASRYGHELSRLRLAREYAKNGCEIARKGGATRAVQDNIKSLFDTVEHEICRAERDNDFIYLHDLPAPTALPPIQAASLVQSAIPAALLDLDTALDQEPIIFGELLSWAAREAINIYNHRKETLLQEQIVNHAQVLAADARRRLLELNLPASLEALEQSVGLPPSLLKMAEEVRREDGPRRIEDGIRDLHTLADKNMSLVNQAFDILDHEASDDEAARQTKHLDRPLSHESNRKLVAMAERYYHILEKSSESDASVQTKWDEWEEAIVELTYDEAELEASMPSSGLPLSGDMTAEGTQTRQRAQELRKWLEMLDELARVRDKHVDKAKRRAEADDVRGRVTKAASHFQRWAPVEPAMFEDILEEELAHYDKFVQRLHDCEEKQEQVLSEITALNQQFLRCRKEDPNVKNRERSLQALELAYHKYCELVRNLTEGMKFYNDLSTMLMELIESCKDWSRTRSQELSVLAASLDDMSLQAPEDTAAETNHPIAPTESAPSSANESKEERVRPALPPLDSDEWQAMLIPPAPKKTQKRTKVV